MTKTIDQKKQARLTGPEYEAHTALLEAKRTLLGALQAGDDTAATEAEAQAQVAARDTRLPGPDRIPPGWTWSESDLLDLNIIDTKLAKLTEQVEELRKQRDELIRWALGSGIQPAEILPYTSVTRARLYQIKDAGNVKDAAKK